MGTILQCVRDAGGVLTREIQGEGYHRANGQTKYAVEVSGYGSTGTQAFDESVTDTACTFLPAQPAHLLEDRLRFLHVKN